MSTAAFSMDSFRLDGRVAVVTGGTGIYGTMFAQALGAAGAHVVITSRDRQVATHGADALVRAGFDASGYRLDQSSPDSVEAFTAAVCDERGSIDVLVNNAVHRAGRGLFDTSPEDWAATSAVNSFGLFILTKAVAKQMAERRHGSIVNIGSIYGVVAPDFTLYEGHDMTSPVFYSYDKAGMIGFTRYLAGQLGPYGVRANCLCPGGFNETGDDGPFARDYAARVPLGRMATGHDVSGALVFLASDASAYVTGAVLPVDGGWTSR
ncbi:MAG: SDR family oxidoreductase [Propionibacteriaceae bacterium]|jgi:NAD(P)-dependent dehydrogenase (short-subunit alcohol dehydrogenase family)|nr:SDR family oxidoreductase [Propionibacteriaceae bacterium]